MIVTIIITFKHCKSPILTADPPFHMGEHRMLVPLPGHLPLHVAQRRPRPGDGRHGES